MKRQQITPTKMSEKGKEFNMPTFGGGVNAKELAIFTRQFSVMIDAGLPLVQCLEILGSQQENKFFQKVLVNTRAMVEGGATLSTAMRSSPKVFDGLYVNMVEAGETGGILDIILQRLSTYIEKNVKLQRAVKSALVYPVGVLTVAGGVITLLLWKVVPIFATLFAGLGVTLPLPTKIVIMLSNFIGSYFGLLILVAMIGSIAGLKVWYGNPTGKFVLDTIILKLPVIGMLMKKIAVARFTRTLGTLISSGVPILEGLDITAKTSGNAVVERALQKVRKALEEGKSLTEPLKECDVFPGHGHADDRGRRTNRRHGRHAAENRGFLRRRSGCRGERPFDRSRTGYDRVPRLGCWWSGHLHVFATLLAYWKTGRCALNASRLTRIETTGRAARNCSPAFFSFILSTGAS